MVRDYWHKFRRLHEESWPKRTNLYTCKFLKSKAPTENKLRLWKTLSQGISYFLNLFEGLICLFTVPYLGLLWIYWQIPELILCLRESILLSLHCCPLAATRNKKKTSSSKSLFSWISCRNNTATRGLSKGGGEVETAVKPPVCLRLRCPNTNLF